MDALVKNLFDLQHSLFSSKGTIFFTLGIGGAISIISLLHQLKTSQPFPIIIELIWFTIFGALAMHQFSERNKIHDRIKKEIEKNK